LRLVVHRQIPEDPALRRQWNQVVFHMEHPQVFYTWEWACAMQSAYRASLKPLLFLGYEGDELIGVASLATDLAERDTSLLAAATSDYCDFCSRPNRRQQFVDAVLAELRKTGVESLALASIPADSSTVAAIRVAARQCGYHVLMHPAQVCARVILGSGEARQKLKATVRGKKMFRRNLRMLEGEGHITLTHLRSWSEIEADLLLFTKVHVARFLVTQQISTLAKPERRHFLEKLARLLSESGWMWLSRLNVGQRAIAWNYGFQFCGSWFWYQPTFESGARIERYSPGFCLLSKVVEEACDTTALDLVDLGVGAESYKDRFANVGRETLDFSLCQSYFRHQREVARHWAARTVKASPKIESVVRSGLRRLDSVRRKFRQVGTTGLIGWGTKRLAENVSRRDEILFYEWTGAASKDSQGTEIRPLDLETLAQGAMIDVHDRDTISYLLRATQRLRREDGSGFALITTDLRPVHYCWVRDFERFYMDELQVRLTAPCKNAVMIFDCWTPHSARGHGFYGLAVSHVAEHLCRAGKAPWIFSASQNIASVRGIAKAGFQWRYSMIRRKVLLWQSVRRLPAEISPATAAVASL
jgi:CelD/BcsL family acetyltransferase involved in cellulose biosynthesis